MTRIRRAAQLIEDLKTLGVIKEDTKVYYRFNEGYPGKKYIMIDISREEDYGIPYSLLKDAFEEEFKEDIKILEQNWLFTVDFL